MTATDAVAELNWTAAGVELVAHLREMIRLKTTNPPGNEMLVGRYLQQVLDKEGIDHDLYEPAPDRAAVVARVRGSGAAAPVMLLAHMDVVDVDIEGWSVDPFGAVVADGCIYGRGAIDDKGMLAVNLMTLILIKRHLVDQGIALERDVIFVATADEETGGEFGLGWLLEHHRDALDAEYALNEGGRIRIIDGRPLYAAIQTAEKASNVVTVTASGPGGHGAVPLDGNAILRLARALAAIEAHPEPVRLLPTTREFFRQLSTTWPDPPIAAAMLQLATDPDDSPAAAALLCQTPTFTAVLRNGVSPTVLAGGFRSNVIPTQATATLSVRTLPGDSVDHVVGRMTSAVDDPLVSITVSSHGIDAPVSEIDSPMFAAIAGAVTGLAPGMLAVPYLSTGATDNARLRAAGIQAYGLLPFPLTEDDERRMHGHDERVPIESLIFGLRLVHSVILGVAR